MLSEKKHMKKSRQKLVPLEPLFRGTKRMLMFDLGTNELLRSFGDKLRGTPKYSSECLEPYEFKVAKQLELFDKRIIWSTDRPTKELEMESFNEFIKAQEGFMMPEPLSRRAFLVMEEAKKICYAICGEFDYESFFDSCTFGKRAACGLPRRISYLDERFNRLSGTKVQISWFKAALSRDMHLFRAVRKRVRKYKILRYIKACAVPKSWKAARIMAPDTVIGGYLSRGLGRLFRNLLERNTHIDLSLQQDRHKVWARKASKNGKYGTIDMRKASDSYVKRHIEYLMHESWHHILESVSPPEVEILGKTMRVKSYMLMGSGHTFPLQTILFYCLAEATRRLMKVNGFVSVYGDDIILPSRISVPFIAVMSELGFTVNSEKSFTDELDPLCPSKTLFRESCGGDYKGGIDVRPYMPECDLQSIREVPRNEFVAWCHKILNGLLDHWDHEEISSTVLYLLQEITSQQTWICFVPAHETDFAGIRHELPTYYTYDLPTIIRPKVQDGVLVYQSLKMVQKLRRKRDVDERPYVWFAYWLQRFKNAVVDPYDDAPELTREADRSREGTYRWKTNYRDKR